MNTTTRWLRAGLWALPISGVLILLATIDHQPDPTTQFDAWSRFVITDRFLASHILASIVGQTIWLLAITTLTASLLRFTRRPGQALAGFVVGALGSAGLIAGFGVAGARALYDDVYGTPALAVLISGVVLFSIASILIGRAALADPRAPRWAAFAFAASGPLIGILGVPLGILQTIGSLATIIGGTALTIALNRTSAAINDTTTEGVRIDATAAEQVS